MQELRKNKKGDQQQDEQTVLEKKERKKITCNELRQLTQDRHQK